MADYCKDFVLTIVSGYEWVSRTSLETINGVKKRLVNCLNNYPHSKYQLDLQRHFPCQCLICKESYCQWNILNAFQRNFEFKLVFATKLAGQIIHITNIKNILDPYKLNIPNSKCRYTPIITSSEEFTAIIFHPKMFTDHLPHKIVNRLYEILKRNKQFFPVCHHFLEHYWPENNPDDIIKLPICNI